MQSGKGPKAFAEVLVKEAEEYNGFNLIMADSESKSMVYVTNRPKGSPISITQVNPGIHVLTNAQLDSPWPKVTISSTSFLYLMSHPIQLFITNRNTLDSPC